MRLALRALLVLFVLSWVSALATSAAAAPVAGVDPLGSLQEADGAAEEAEEPAAGEQPEIGGVDAMFGQVNGVIGAVVFFGIPVPFSDQKIPLAVLILVCGAIFFTVRMGFPQFRSFRHAIDVVRG